LLLWTNDYHHLVHGPAQLWMVHGLAELKWSPGLWFHVDTVYMYLIIIAGVWFLARSLSHNGDLHRSQIKIILAGACLPLIPNLAYLSPLSANLQNLDLSVVFFTLAGGVYYYAIIRHKFLDLIPVAHSILIKSMTDSVVVLDVQDRIVEMNPAAALFLGVSREGVVGRPAREILLGWREITQPFWDQLEVRTEIVITQNIPRYIDLNITPLVDSKKRTTGRILVFRDITSRKQSESVLKDTNKTLHEQLDEISTLRDQLSEQATRDPLTNLYNRRYLEDKLSQELARASRENYPVCVIMVDIDRFKRVNDTCGHKVGDDVLQALASLIILHIRCFDSACRYGGEEFVIVMPKLSVETARERAEFLRREFANMPICCPDMKSRPTLSIGLAAYPRDGTNGDQLLNAADQAMYAAKSAGRNRTVIYSDVAEKGELSNGKKSK
jgi:diguanylate cyclase (GGDEF)-like protein/PAS domain S-box-containing protein